MIRCTRKKYEYADDPYFHVGAKVAIYGHESYYDNGIHIPCMDYESGVITEIWVDKHKNVSYVIFIEAWKQSSSGGKIRMYSDEIYPLEGKKTSSSIKRSIQIKKDMDEKVIYLLPKKPKAGFLIGPRESKSVDLGQYLKLNLTTSEVSCHVRGSNTIQIIDSIGRKLFCLNSKYREMLMDNQNFEKKEYIN